MNLFHRYSLIILFDAISDIGWNILIPGKINVNQSVTNVSTRVYYRTNESVVVRHSNETILMCDEFKRSVGGIVEQSAHP